jgi:hypothetical protein
MAYLGNNPPAAADKVKKARFGWWAGQCCPARSAGQLQRQLNQAIVLLARFDKSLSTPVALYARMAKYQVPLPRLPIM